MALIKCPECGKEISDTSKNCVHCGYSLKKEKIIPKKIFLIGGTILLIIIAIVVMVKITSKNTIQHTKVFEVMDYSQSSSIKKELGDDYKYVEYGDTSSSETYENIEIDGLLCSSVEISYYEDLYRLIIIDVLSISDKEKDVLIKDFIAHYGKDYEYIPDDSDIEESFNYFWKPDDYRGIILNITENEEDGMYRVMLSSYW